MNCGLLKHRIDVYSRVKRLNEFKELTYDYECERTVWAEIVPKSGREEDMPGNSIKENITHKITVRKGAIKDPRNDMYFMYRGQRFDVMYFMPHYRKNDLIEFYCKMTIEGENDYEQKNK